jgi:uncharacterized MAPEG superfamily protein
MQLHLILAAFILLWIPRICVATASAFLPEGFNNRHPRAQQSKLTGWAFRANSAHYNSIEAFCFIAPAVLACAARGIAFSVQLEWIWVISRLVYIVAYIGDVHILRSTSWIVAIAVNAYLFIIAI